MQLIRYMRSLANNGSKFTHQSREFDFALGFDFDATPRTLTGSRDEVRTYELLESLCDELELEQQGMQSPPYAVVLPVAERRRVNVPEAAAYFTFVYPLTPWSKRTRESQHLLSTDGGGGGDSFETGEPRELRAAAAAMATAGGSSAGSRAEKIDRFLNEPVPMEEDDDDAVKVDRRRRYAWGCFFLLGGFAYYDGDGNLLRIIAFSSGRVDVSTAPLTLEGPFEARPSATRALWDTRRMNKVSLPALLLEGAHTFSWVGPGSADDALLAERFQQLCHGGATRATAGEVYPSIDDPAPHAVVPGELVVDGADEWHPLSLEESWEHGAFVFCGGDPNCVRDKGPRDIFFRVVPATPWRQRVGSLLANQVINMNQALAGLPTPGLSRRTSGEVNSTIRVPSAVPSAMPSAMPSAARSPLKLRLRAMLQPAEAVDAPTGETDLHSTALRLFWFDDAEGACAADGGSKGGCPDWKRCDEAANKAVRAMVDGRHHGASWSSGGWQYVARVLLPEGQLVQRNESSGRERRLLLRFEYGGGEPCGARVDERLTRAVLLGEPAAVLEAGGPEDGGTGAPQPVFPLGRKRSEERKAQHRLALTAGGGRASAEGVGGGSMVLPSPRWWSETPTSTPLPSPRLPALAIAPAAAQQQQPPPQQQQQQALVQQQQQAPPSLARRLLRAARRATMRERDASTPALPSGVAFSALDDMGSGRSTMAASYC